MQTTGKPIAFRVCQCQADIGPVSRAMRTTCGALRSSVAVMVSGVEALALPQRDTGRVDDAHGRLCLRNIQTDKLLFHDRALTTSRQPSVAGPGKGSLARDHATFYGVTPS
jgi:hypothetical protein